MGVWCRVDELMEKCGMMFDGLDALFTCVRMISLAPPPHTLSLSLHTASSGRHTVRGAEERSRLSNTETGLGSFLSCRTGSVLYSAISLSCGHQLAKCCSSLWFRPTPGQTLGGR